ncbi:MAG: hypothetical protein OQJ95_06160 [Kangiella sp.]|nr:hypothetical protein [Kangiella sp.]
MKTFLTLLKREYWENKTGLQWVPMIIGGIAVFGVFLGVFVFSTSNVQINGVGSHDLTSLFKLYDVSVDPRAKAIGVQMGIYSGIFSFGIVLAIVGFFYCLGALYDDRKDRSILFWKSMPVSDSMTVLSKVVTVMVVAPLFVWVILQLTTIAIMILGTLFAWISDASAWHNIWQPSNLFVIAFYQLQALYVATLWAAPIIGYLLLVSSWTKKVPFLVATVPVILVIIAESIVTNTAYVVSYIGERFVMIWSAYITPVGKIAGDFSDVIDDDVSEFIEEDWLPLSFGEHLMDMDLWFGLAFGAVLVVGAIMIRRYRDEAL